MLPDLPSLKAEIQEVLDIRMRNVAHSNMGILDEVPQIFVHEGHKMRTARADGSTSLTDFQQASAETIIQRSEVSKLSLAARLAILDRMARELAAKVHKGVFESLNLELKEAGQTVDSHGQPLSMELIFAALEKMDMDFDNAGNPVGLKFVITPDQAPIVERLQEQFNNDPAAQRRHKELMDRKRREFRAREAARKLVG